MKLEGKFRVMKNNWKIIIRRNRKLNIEKLKVEDLEKDMEVEVVVGWL